MYEIKHSTSLARCSCWSEARFLPAALWDFVQRRKPVED